MTIEYDKLVRDRIPELITASGKTCETRILSDEAYLQRLENKLDEEVAEFHQDHSIEELADVVEVIHALVQAKGYSVEDLERIREQKKTARGGFAEKILLLSVTQTEVP